MTDQHQPVWDAEAIIQGIETGRFSSRVALRRIVAELAAVRAEPRYVPVSDGTHTLMNTDDAFVSVTVEDDGKQTIEHWQPGGVTPCPMPDSYRLCRLVPGQDTPAQEGSE